MAKIYLLRWGKERENLHYRRIAELEQHPVATQTIPKLFHYDPDEPLHLIQEKTRE